MPPRSEVLWTSLELPGRVETERMLAPLVNETPTRSMSFASYASDPGGDASYLLWPPQPNGRGNARNFTQGRPTEKSPGWRWSWLADA